MENLEKYLQILDESYPLTERLSKIRNRFFETMPEVCSQRARYYTESYKTTEQYPVTIRRALGLKNVCEKIDLFIGEGELIVGAQAEKLRGASVFPEMAYDWLIREFNGDPYNFRDRPGDPFDYDEKVKDELLNEIFPFWYGKSQADRLRAIVPEDTWVADREIGAFNGSWHINESDGHIIPDYEKVINVGVNGILKEIDEKIAGMDLTVPENLRALPYLKSMRIANEAALIYAQRFAKLASDMACEEKDATRKAELERISKIAARVPAEPAQTFYEALQSVMFINVVILLEGNGPAHSFGRFDQYMYPFYKADLDAGRITVEEAHELLNCFWMKLNEMTKFNDWHNTKDFVGYLVYENMTIGGQDIRGNDSVNELTYLCLASTKKLKMIQPSMTVRVFQRTDSRFLFEAAKTVALGIGLPSFFNDEVIIPSMMEYGHPYADAVNYGIVGCVEPSVPGKGAGRHGACFTNPSKILELTLHGGKDPITGKCFRPCKTLAECKDYDEFVKEYQDQLKFWLKHHVIFDNTLDYVWEDVLPEPFLCSYISDCIQRGKDIRQGGAVYDFTGGVFVGVATAINSLAALKQVLFEKKLLTADQLMHALDTNFEDRTTTPTGEQVRQILLNEAPKFGNDDAVTNDISYNLMDFWIKNKTSYKNTKYGRGPIGGRFMPSTATVATNVGCGKCVGATPDGRKAYDQLSEGVSASPGTDVNGPTALINSVSTMPNVGVMGGQLLNIKLNPSCMQDDTGYRNFVALIRAFFLEGGMQAQFNVVKKETLLAAQKEPEKYQNLIVRVAGYSAFFNTLSPDVQDAIIARTEHTL